MTDVEETESPKRRRSRWQWLKDAFSMEPYYEPFTEEELALLDRIAGLVSRRGMSVPAILFLETGKPLNYIGSQAMAFFEPLVRSLFSAVEYVKLRRILERRQSVETLIQMIEKHEEKRDN